MSDKHAPNVISIGRDTSPSPLPVLVFLAALVGAGLLIVAFFEPRDESHKFHPTGTAKTTTVTVEHDGHRLILATTMFSVSVIHHPDCPCQARAER